MKKVFSLILALLFLSVSGLVFAQDAPTGDQPQAEAEGDAAGQTAQEPAPVEEGVGPGEVPAPTAEAPAEGQDQLGAGDDQQAEEPDQGVGGDQELPANLIKLNELRDMDLGSGDQNQGSIDDVVLTADGKVSHVIASLENIEGVDDGRYLVPFEALSLAQTGEDTVQVDAAGAQGFELVAEDIRPSGIASDSVLLSSLMDYDFINNQNEQLDGSIEDIVADRETGEIKYVAFNVGGTLGIGGELVAVPYSEVWYHLTDRTVRLDVTQEQLDQVEGFENDNWPAEARSDWKPAAAEDQEILGAEGEVDAAEDQEILGAEGDVDAVEPAAPPAEEAPADTTVPDATATEPGTVDETVPPADTTTP